MIAATFLIGALCAQSGAVEIQAGAIDRGAVFVNANTAYQQGDYPASARGYEQLTTDGVDNGYVWFNLGNASLRSGRLGAAIAAYLRAQSLLPRDADVRANLLFARQSTKDAIEPRQSAAVLRTLFFWHFSFSLLELVQAVGVANLLLWALLAWRLYRRESELSRWAVIVALGALVALGGSLLVRVTMPPRVAVMQNVEVDVHSGTSRDTVVQFKLHAGTETRWVETRGEWLRIALPDEKQGWVHEEDVVALVL